MTNEDKRFRKRDRILQQQDFERVHRSRWFAADRTLVVKGSRNTLTRSRLGLSLSRKVGNAVVRNRWKRIIREAFRQNRPEIPEGWDLVVRPRKGAVPEYAHVVRSLVKLSRRIHRNAG